MMNQNTRRITTFLTTLMALFLISGNSLADTHVLTISTTTSTQSSGLFDILLPEFKKDTGITVKAMAKGTGAAIRDGIDGNVDLIFVHAKAREEKFVSEGYGTKRYAVMHNDFIILGPSKNPAGITKSDNVAIAMKKIADSKSIFVSRGDDSGTHTKEQTLWKNSGVNLMTMETTITKKGKNTKISFTQPEDSEKQWYMAIGQGMGKALTYAEEKQGYLLCDRGTYIKYKYGRSQGLDLDIISEGDNNLMNPYGAIPVNPVKFPHVKNDLAQKFAEWLVSKRGQQVIGEYKLNNKQLFFPDAI